MPAGQEQLHALQLLAPNIAEMFYAPEGADRRSSRMTLTD